MTTTPLVWKPLTQVNTTDAAVGGGTPSQYDGQTARLGDGGYVVVFTDDSRVHQPGHQTLLAQKYNALGQKVGGEIEIGFTDTDNIQPALTALPDGGFAVACTTVSAVQGTALTVRRYDVSLGLVTTDIHIGPGTSNASIAAFTNGSYVFSYTDTNGGTIRAGIVTPGVFGRIPVEVHNEPDAADFSEVAVLSNGNFVVVFEDQFNGSATDIDIKFRIFTPTGTPVTSATAAPGAFGTGAEVDPSVAALAGGGFVIVWTDPDSTVTDIRAGILTNTGGVVVSDALVNATTAGEQNEPNVLALPDGGFVVTWEDHAANLVRAQRFDAVANRIGTEFVVKVGLINNAGATNDSPKAALLSDGRFAYAVGDNSSGDADVQTSIWDIYGPRPADFNHDVRSDLLWRHDGDGLVGEWLMNGGAAPATTAFSGAPPEWNLEGTGDFNGDGRSDILWRHVGGDIGTWHMNGTQVLSTQVFALAPPQWHVQGTADFNGDGKTDLLWRHDDGTVGTWHMNGATTISTQTFANAPPDWHIRGTGDFNGDGFDDILWQHDNGAVGTWHMNGATTLSTQAFASQPADWQVQGTGDFNGDGRDDILWRHDSGIVGIWLMNGAQIIGGPTFGGTGNDWHIEGSGDFNGDGKADILWRNDDGTVASWHMNGAQILSTASFGAQPADWHIVGQQFDYI